MVIHEIEIDITNQNTIDNVQNSYIYKKGVSLFNIMRFLYNSHMISRNKYKNELVTFPFKI